MKVVTSIPKLKIARNLLREPVGFVPTMGYLHEGHLSLVRAARSECTSVVVSIYVNPTQFAPHEDLGAYPRDLARDLNLLAKEGVHLIWTPDEESMYPPGFQTWVNVETVSQGLEGSQRPTHFRGVATVVAKLFNAVRPQKAYFGQKDAQQAMVIRQMARDLNFDLQIRVCPIVREADGLALSSRNVYLSSEERQAATILYRALNKAQAAYQSGERNAHQLRQIVTDTINSEPLAQLQYVSCADGDTLQEISEIVKGRALLSMAVYLGKTRLIDNCILGE